MTRRMSLRAELEALRAEIEALKPPQKAAQPEGAAHEIGELNRLVKAMLDDAETTIAEHPVATVAGALALGIVIGRLTAQ